MVGIQKIMGPRDKSVVSIITPTYNHERFIAECIESVLTQTHEAWEMLIVDDGSTDKTWEIVQSYAQKDSRIRAFRQENKGIWRLAETYNFALERSRGELVAILEGDDYWEKEKLAKQAALHVQDPDLLMSYGKVFVVEDKRIIREFYRPTFSGKISSLRCLRLLFLRESCITPVSTVFRREALLSIGGFHQDDGTPAVDYSTFYRYLQLPGNVAWLDTPLGYWRQSAEQVTKKLGIEFSEAVLRVALEQFDTMPGPLRKELDLTRTRITRAQYRAGIAPGYLGALRQALIHNRKKNAFFYANKLFVYGSPKQKLQGVYGLAAALIGTDMESTFSVYEKLFLPKRSLWQRSPKE